MAYVRGQAAGKLLASNLEISFWGGVNRDTGEIVDSHHTLHGQRLPGCILAIPGGRGSCSGSAALLELLMNGKGPGALIFERREEILTLGVMVAEEVFGKSIPVVVLSPGDFKSLLSLHGLPLHVQDGRVSAQQGEVDYKGQGNDYKSQVHLSELDQAFLDGQHGEACRIAMRVIIRMADLLDASELINVSQVHVDGCIYTGPASLAFANLLREKGAKVRVPTSLNSISIDQKRWRAQGVDLEFGEAAEALAEAYVAMGARPTYTCAPYQLDTAPGVGEQVAWAESNAVVYANSVLGAKTMKYPDFLDIFVALTGRAPNGGPHVESHRKATLKVQVVQIDQSEIDDSFWPLLGYCVGLLSGNNIPAIAGLESTKPSNDDLKAFGAAFATVCSAPMFHIGAITPEAATLDDALSPSYSTLEVGFDELIKCWTDLNGASSGSQIGLVSLGNPHFSFLEMRKLANLCQGRQRSKNVAVMVTCSRTIYSLADQAGLTLKLEAFGVEFLTDICWCMITESTLPSGNKAVMTNSAKYAHYGPDLIGRDFSFGSLSACVEAACEGVYDGERPKWLRAVRKA
ncbi:hypothetical protein N3K66_002411 [Trichothecium roseum]|uniref:Uncharacterized protein n=1 Tax=Trichothecium roseum TaxID=47278 RepID=A0ACC0VA33_9HYPO|nr:hypothetical protein N3K66_002411 [Trichothecium roseum]